MNLAGVCKCIYVQGDLTVNEAEATARGETQFSRRCPGDCGTDKGVETLTLMKAIVLVAFRPSAHADGALCATRCPEIRPELHRLANYMAVVYVRERRQNSC